MTEQVEKGYKERPDLADALTDFLGLGKMTDGEFKKWFSEQNLFYRVRFFVGDHGYASFCVHGVDIAVEAVSFEDNPIEIHVEGWPIEAEFVHDGREWVSSYCEFTGKVTSNE